MQALVSMDIFKTNIYHVYDANFRVSISDISSSDRQHIFLIASLSQGLIFFFQVDFGVQGKLWWNLLSYRDMKNNS